jgi:hypothetical protein
MRGEARACPAPTHEGWASDRLLENRRASPAQEGAEAGGGGSFLNLFA